jgi:hypothetical protein
VSDGAIRRRKKADPDCRRVIVQKRKNVRRARSPSYKKVAAEAATKANMAKETKTVYMISRADVYARVVAGARP